MNQIFLLERHTLPRRLQREQVKMRYSLDHNRPSRLSRLMPAALESIPIASSEPLWKLLSEADENHIPGRL